MRCTAIAALSLCLACSPSTETRTTADVPAPTPKPTEAATSQPAVVSASSAPTVASSATAEAPAPSAAPSAVASAASAPEPASAWVKINPGKPMREQLQREVAAAKKANLKPVLYFGAVWCNPCKAIKKGRNDPLMVHAFRGVHIVEVDVDKWEDSEEKSVGATSAVIPVFFGLGEDGRVDGKRIDGGAWGEDVPANMAPPLKAFFSKL